MDANSYSNFLQETANQTLGGKEIRFPTGGLSGVIESTRFGNPVTPACVNVILRSPSNVGNCGGTRPGLKSFSGVQPYSDGVSRFMWPNGQLVKWPECDNISFENMCSKVIMPDGSVMLNQHESFKVRVSKGNVPSSCTVMSLYRARIVVAKDSMWYASRSGAYDDFDYGGDFEDVSRAAAGSVALAGREGDPITALASVSDYTMLIATRHSLWRVDKEITNAVMMVSDNIGIISKDAWCFDGVRFWFIGENGLYSMVVGEQPMLMTKHLKNRFTGWNSATLIYDSERNGIHIIGNVGNPTAVATDWFYDIDRTSAWPIVYPSAIRPISGGMANVSTRSRAVFVCNDNSFRYWDESQTTDDGTDIKSVLTLGPVTHTTGNTENSFLAEIDVEFDKIVTTSDGVNVTGITGNTTNDVLKKSEDFLSWVMSGASGTSTDERFRYTFSDGWNRVKRPRVRCNSVALTVWSTNRRWAISKATIVQRGCGRIRK